MVAEDDKLCASLMQKVLARLLVAGTVVSNGVEAVALYEQGAWSGACACGASRKCVL
jgi:CheY-like chemotaxis protein